MMSRTTRVRDILFTLSPDGNSLYAVNSGANSIAVIPLTDRFFQQGGWFDPDRVGSRTT